MDHSAHALALEPLALKLAKHVDLGSADRAAILALPCIVKRMERHQYIVRERELATHSVVMLSGYSILSKLVAGGGRQILAIHMAGDAVDLQNSILKVADHSVQMLTRGEVALIPREEVIHLAINRPKVGLAMWWDTLVDASKFREWLANVGRRDARTRVAHILCEFSLCLKVAGLGGDNDYELPMTQEQLADSTGLTAVHVNRMLKSLQSDGLIHRSSTRSVRIGDWRNLAEAGDFDSTYLHLNRDEPALV